MKVAIVEDNIEYTETLKKYLLRFENENKLNIAIYTFTNGEQFINEFKSDYDIIFMDIEMPIMDGIESSTKIREIDSECVIIFVSNFTKYAIKGYSVNALDYLTKPLAYDIFKNTMSKAILKVQSKQNKAIVLQSGAETYRIDINDIIYIEVYKHRVFFHTTKDDFDIRSSLQEVEKQLPSNQFIRCNSGYIINLKYVSGIQKDSIIVFNKELPISRSRKKEVLEILTRYIGS
ncbi:MAG: LytTR family DNA-binding domain-containing protein [Bacillales bacterium]|nr:LytTR family DNA-binding domain-containing protein [Bacillales bacterium]